MADADFDYIQGIRDLEYRILDVSGTMIPYRKISEIADEMVKEVKKNGSDHRDD